MHAVVVSFHVHPVELFIIALPGLICNLDSFGHLLHALTVSESKC